MTKKQTSFIVAAFVILITLIIICSANYVRKTKETAEKCEQAEIPEVKMDYNITQLDISDILESDQKSTTSNTKNSTPVQTGSGTQSASAGGNMLRKTLKTAPPESSGYPIPKNHHFYKIEGSVVPGNKDYADLSIRMNSSENYNVQLQELKTVILPVLGEDITNQVISIAKTKTDINVEFRKVFKNDTREVCVSSCGNNPLVSFQSWQK